jgi:alpha-galactosidase
MQFSAENLPTGIHLDTKTGFMTGSVKDKGDYHVTLQAKNALGEATLKFKIVVGEQIALTPPMGWNSWNCWHSGINEEICRRMAYAMVGSGLAQHGWTYINIDDAWQGTRGGEFNTIQGDPKRFPGMKALADDIHGLGLKAGLYSTPWVTSYAGHVGGSSENPDGTWDRLTMSKGPKNKKVFPFAIGKYHFFKQDAQQWAAWGFDYLKFDWALIEMPETQEMAGALRESGRDIVLSLSNNATNTVFNFVSDLSKCTNSWRISGDISDTWASLKSHGFGNDKWAPFSGPGHWNDPDMFEVGTNGGGTPKRLTADEQYTHVTQWCLLSAPLLLGCDLEHLDNFTLGLLTNDEVLAVNQDALGKQATNVSSHGDAQIYAKQLEDGSWAVGLFNLGETPVPVTLKWTDLGISGNQTVRDLWRQKDLGSFAQDFSMTVAPHGAEMIRLMPGKQN